MEPHNTRARLTIDTLPPETRDLLRRLTVRRGEDEGRAIADLLALFPAADDLQKKYDSLFDTAVGVVPSSSLLTQRSGDGGVSHALADLAFRAVSRVRRRRRRPTAMPRRLTRGTLAAMTFATAPSLRSAESFVRAARLSTVARARMPFSTVVREERDAAHIPRYYFLAQRIEDGVLHDDDVAYTQAPRLVHDRLRAMSPSRLCETRDGALLFLYAHGRRDDDDNVTPSHDGLATEIFRAQWTASGWRDPLLRKLLWALCDIDLIDDRAVSDRWFILLQNFVGRSPDATPPLWWRSELAANVVVRFCAPMWLMRDAARLDAPAAYVEAFEAVAAAHVANSPSWDESVLAFWRVRLARHAEAHGIELELPERASRTFDDLRRDYEE